MAYIGFSFGLGLYVMLSALQLMAIGMVDFFKETILREYKKRPNILDRLVVVFTGFLMLVLSLGMIYPMLKYWGILY